LTEPQLSWELLATAKVNDPLHAFLTDLWPDDTDLDRQAYPFLLTRVLRSVLQHLSHDDRDILVSFFGLFGHAPIPLGEYGATHEALSGERIRQFKSAILSHLQQPYYYLPLIGFVEDVSLTDRVATLHRARFYRALAEWEHHARFERELVAQRELDRIDSLVAKHLPRQSRFITRRKPLSRMT